MDDDGSKEAGRFVVVAVGIADPTTAETASLVGRIRLADPDAEIDAELPGTILVVGDGAAMRAALSSIPGWTVAREATASIRPSARLRTRSR